MEPCCPHCDAPDTALLRVVLIGEILRAPESHLGLLADVMQQCGLPQLLNAAEEPVPVRRRPHRGPLQRRPR
jgi:hypothetical protein